MNNNLKKCIYSICKRISRENDIEGMFATNLESHNIVILNFVIDSSPETHKIEKEVHIQEIDEVFYECYIFYHYKEEYNNLDYANLDNKQINFLELLNLSDIFIDKTGILHYLQEYTTNIFKIQGEMQNTKKK